MKILYGIQTTGHGHIVRGRAMVKELIRQGHQVHIILSGPPLKDNWIPDYFENFEHFKGLTYVIEQGRINIPKTAKILDVPQFIYDVVKYEPKDYDIVVTDYEPISSRFAQINKIPSIGIGHLYAFVHKVPMPTIPNPFHILIMRYFAPANFPIGLHWHHFNAPILPPTIPPDVRSADSVQKDKIIVYLHFEGMQDIIDLFKPFPNYDFYVYYPVDEPFDEGNIHFRPLSRDNFQRDLSDAIGVIANSGFSLSSEAIHLGKKLLAKPVKGQTEQEANASALEELNLGRVMKDLDRNAVEEWLEDPLPTPAGYPDAFEDIAAWIGRGNWQATDKLVEQLWAQTNHMPAFDTKPPIQ
jgi:uncharacterized protein (TIGR00661 family)